MPGVNVPVSDLDFAGADAADKQAKAMVHHHNKKEYKSSLHTAGMLVWPRPGLANGKAIQSGDNVNFVRKGIFNGKWILEEFKINLTGGQLDTELEWRKCQI